ncbi:MAG: phosphoribosylformylglycinamidine synthase subunit PurS [Candidatus Methylomirabilis sp.]|nr:phosphoribosylformylglycinamidine synthase subunit PurS [Deltaproteobacteria bacterium]
MKARIRVTLKNGVLDPQGKAVEGSLHHLGHAGVSNVRIGKYIELDVAADSADEARAQCEEMCRKLLANPVIENFTCEVEG